MMSDANQHMTVGVRHDGRVVLSVLDSRGVQSSTDFSLELAEWLRDRLFHLCAYERAIGDRIEKGRGE